MTPEVSEIRALTLRLDARLHRVVRLAAAAADVSVTQFIVEALEDAVGLSERGGDADSDSVSSGRGRSYPARSESSFQVPAGPRGFKRGGADPKVKKYPARKKEGS